MTVAANLSSTKRLLLERMLAGEASRSAQADEIPRCRSKVAPLAPEQMNIWLHAQSTAAPIYNEPIVVRRTGPLDIAALEKALSAVLRSHSAWRSSIAMVDRKLVQRVADAIEISLPVDDLSHLPADQREREALRQAQEDSRRPIPLDAAPLMRAKVFRLSADAHILYIVLHHIAFDGVSLSRIFLPQLAEFYDAYARGETLVAAPSGVQFIDYALWREREYDRRQLERDVGWWREQLAGDLPDMVLPTDRRRTKRSTHESGIERFTLSADLSAALRALSRREGVTLYATLLAAFKTLLHRMTGAEDIVIGGVTDTRQRPELESTIGCFLNTIALRTRPSAEMPFRAYLSEVQDTVLGALDHRLAPFEEVLRSLHLKRDPLRHPLFSVMFSIQPPPAAPVEGWQLSQMDVATGYTKFDLYLELEERDDDIIGRFLYATDLFDAGSIRRLVGYWCNLLEGVVAKPESRLGALRLLDSSDSSRPSAFRSGRALTAPHPTVTAWLAETARTRARAIAVQFEGKTLSYQALDRRAEALARRLRHRGIRHESLVALAVERSLETPIYLLAILKAGGAWLPLDPSQPSERLAEILRDAAPALILTDSASLQRLPQSQLRTFVVDAPEAGPPTGNGNGSAAPIVPDPDSLAYVIYTSGSTGRPKGVEVCHRALVNLLADVQQEFALEPSDCALAVNTLSFDFSVAEFLLPLVSGARLVVAGREDTLDPSRLADLAGRTRCTLMQATPTTWRGLVHAGWKGSTKLKIVSGGEELPRDLAEALLKRSAGLWNVYGPTETTIFATIEKVESGDGRVPIGRPVANSRLYLLDKSGLPVPDGVPGELYIAGAGLGRGYRNDPTLTARKYVNLPSLDKERRLYRTGDLVRQKANGGIEWLGRADNQVKVRGHRIAVEEIETAICLDQHVAYAAVRTWTDASGETSLCAYIVPKGAGELSSSRLRKSLRQRLPDYMLPQRFVTLREMPLTTSGKIDRNRLPEPHVVETGDVKARPRDEIEARMAESWGQLLGVSNVGIHDNFFELGGHSVLAFLAILDIKKFTDGRELPVSVLLENPTIAEFASFLRAAPSDDSFSHLVPLRREGTSRPLFIVHGALGNVVAFKSLADRIEWDRPIYAIQAKGVDPRDEPLGSIDEMADTYLAAIQAVQPQGPYALSGYSFGGLIAYEMACRLRERGEQVDFLALLDTDLHPRNLPPLERTLYHLSVPFRLARKLEEVPLRAWPDYLSKRAAMAWNRLLIRFDLRERGRPLNEWNEPLPESSERMYEISLRSFLTFSPRPFDGVMHFFRAAVRTIGECDPLPAWRAAAATVVVHTVEGAHGTILSDRHVGSLAKAMSTAAISVAFVKAARPGVAMGVSTPRVLIVTTLHWPSTTRFAIALAKGGFSTAVVAPRAHPLRRLAVCEAFFRLRPECGEISIDWAIQSFAPDLLLPVDEGALFHLHALHRHALERGDGALASLIERSLGGPTSYPVIERREAVVELARREGVAVPETRTFRVGDAEAGFIDQAWPLVLKLDGTSGGLGVRIVEGPRDLGEAARELVQPPWPVVFKDMFLEQSLGPLRARLRPRERRLIVQRFIPGRCANRAVFAWEGRVVAGISVEVLETLSETGSSTVVRLTDNADMETAAAKLVRRLGLSGFCGFDFILEEATGRAVLLEINARVTPSCHLSTGEASDMIGAMRSALGASRITAGSQLRTGDLVAYFPGEFWRDAESAYLHEAFHDVPWDEPAFIETYLRRHSAWLMRIAPHVRGLWPSLAERKITNLIPAKGR